MSNFLAEANACSGWINKNPGRIPDTRPSLGKGLKRPMKTDADGHIACIMIYGNGLKGKMLIFPDQLQVVLRAKYPSTKAPCPDPNSPKVHWVTYKELAEVKWPQ
ncbi:uncharacterized protein [Ptychodera flava]|uniref:uncharacterized protein n=1 Tax=Ptychodera flava TaxID=63121 RepID=UPI00396A8EB5